MTPLTLAGLPLQMKGTSHTQQLWWLLICWVLLFPATSTVVFVLTLGDAHVNLTVHWLVGSVSADNVSVDSDRVLSRTSQSCFVPNSGLPVCLIHGLNLWYLYRFISYATFKLRIGICDICVMVYAVHVHGFAHCVLHPFGFV